MKKNILSGIAIFLLTIVLILVVGEAFQPNKPQMEVGKDYQASTAELVDRSQLRK